MDARIDSCHQKATIHHHLSDLLLVADQLFSAPSAARHSTTLAL